MLIYLDLCSFNRPYHDQTQSRIRLETEAKILLQQKIWSGECELLWSSILDLENAFNPFLEHRMAIARWRELTREVVFVTEQTQTLASQFASFGLGSYDAMHLACAVAGKADCFVTTDDRLLKRAKPNSPIDLYLPGEALAKLEHWYEN